MKKVIIAEKPKIAMAIVGALGNFQKYDGYFENDNYIVTFAFGHLFTLYSIDDYLNRDKSSWKLSDLPFVPEQYKFKLKDDKGVQKQFNIIKNLVNRNDVDTIINCGDADREGEVIINLIITNALESKKNIKRLWLPEQTSETIRSNLRNLKDINHYTNLMDEGLLRTYVDWLYGINLTQLVSCKKGDLFSVGRVIIPIVELIYTRDKNISDFKPKKYSQIELVFNKDNTNIKLTTDDLKFEKIEDAKSIKESMIKDIIKVRNIENKDVKRKPKNLFSLDKLQNKIGKEFKLSANDSLNVIQGLYEKGYVTYPRTNTEYLAEEEKEKTSKIINAFNIDGKLELKETKKIFDSSKVESHSAITPTTKIPKDLKGIELEVYNIIKNRFLSNFLIEDCIVSETIVTFEFNQYEFKLKGTSIKQLGFLAYENDLKEKTIPNFSIGEEIRPNIELLEKFTQPPKHITLDELNNYLKNPFKKDCMSEDEEYKQMLDGVEIGTVATRGAIIERAKKLKYIIEKNNTFYIDEKGNQLMKALSELNIDMFKDKTVELSKILKKVYKQELSKEEAMNIYSKDLSNTVESAKMINVQKVEVKKVEKEILGKCPKCGKNVYESEKLFYCEDFKNCTFRIFKNNKFFEDKGKKVTKSMVKSLLSTKSAKVKGFKKKDGSGKYDATVNMSLNGDYVNFNLSFDKK
ncbi:DNA topoisomerase [Paraclostridium sordellii]|uniref:DNA topoisomerase n=1 Tax=Paraclostridium sordellii TaxID=1505 RepID=UPI000E4B9C9D|nr:DNA topoisomerase [Paeniclostridium sordellii]RGX06272.1 DNA topoisomerase III [Paeniclostridium sordellii]